MIELGTRDIFRWHTDETGQSVVEFAVILPALALLVIGVLVVGQVIIAQYAVQSAAREAARVGAEVGVQSNPWELAQNLARDRALQVLQDRGLETSGDNPAISFEGSNTDYERGEKVKVELRYEYTLPLGDLPLLRPIFGPGGTITLEAEASYRIQRYKSRWP